MNAGMTAQLVTDALVMAIWRRGKPDAARHGGELERGARMPSVAPVPEREHIGPAGDDREPAYIG